jgi:hypothetical protein
VPGAQTVTLESGGALERVWIRENRIAGMGGDGSGVAFFFDAAPRSAGPSDIIIVRNLRVLGNLITGCNTAEREPVNDFLALWSGHGGIALADVEDGVWRDNEIRDNGTGNPDPLCGVFVLNVLGAVLDRNRITNNGQRRAEHAGWLGGIVLPLVSPSHDGPEASWDGRAAARVADNVVVAPEGPAVILRAFFGALLVERNELTTFTTWVASNLGQAVEIVNFGFFSEFQGGSTTADRGGQIVFSNNTVTWQPPRAEGTGLWITRLASLDDVCARDNVGRVDLGELVMLADMFAWAPTVDVADNRLRETLLRTLWSIASFGLLNQTVDNVTTHCVYVWDRGTVSGGEGNRSMVDVYFPDERQPNPPPSVAGGITGAYNHLTREGNFVVPPAARHRGIRGQRGRQEGLREAPPLTDPAGEALSGPRLGPLPGGRVLGRRDDDLRREPGFGDGPRSGRGDAAQARPDDGGEPCTCCR